MRPSVVALALLVAVPLATSGCGNSARPEAAAPHAAASASATVGADGVQEIVIDTTDAFRFAPATVDAHVGKLRIVLMDAGSYPHNIAFPALHATSATVSGTPSEQKKMLTVTFDKPGTYEFVCTYHSSAGMKGRVVVS
ncbi:MAG: cupredoxin domain-containing protein [Frankiaceae bacterium]|nr:cupredoxin domain-containing protein [Frankiaceae bacterium]MBV9369995.1 cupredoxin domain-containing protein [Frankiales bacterium]